jgi:hypothetical protein
MNVDAIARHALISHFLLDRALKKQFACHVPRKMGQRSSFMNSNGL